MICPTCGNANRAKARFCEECGALLAESPEVGIPTTLAGDRYHVIGLLGEGARKRVYHARDNRLGREVAVALVKTDGLDDAGRARIAREARAMARLGDHPSVVTVFDVDDHDGAPLIVTQLMAGGSLAELLDAAEGHRLPIDESIAILCDVAAALGHAHALDIVHRDVKPANVWLDGSGVARLGDFGLAVPADEARLTAEGIVVGTAAYLAPEQAMGREPDPRADLYALGAMGYEMLCGRPPFLGDDAAGVITQHLHAAPVAPSWHRAGIPPGLEALVLALLAKDPDARPANAHEVVDALRDLGRVPEALAPPQVVDVSAPIIPVSGRLVGRGDELAALRAALDDTLAGSARLVLVVGEPGIGKTRLSEELATHARLQGAQVCWGRCHESDLAVPYLPFIEVLRAYVRTRPDDELRAELGSGAPDVAALVSELRERFPDLPPSPLLDADAERLRLFESVASFLHHAAAVQPLVLVLDDLHWADRPSLLLLAHLARRFEHERVLLVGTYRDVDVDRTHPLADTLALLRRERLHQRLALTGLPRDDVKALIADLGDQEPTEGFTDTITRATEGNPLFVAEILRHLIATGALQRVDGKWTGTSESIAAELPEGVREVIGRRLSRLSDDCNALLVVAAVMAGGFTLDVAAAAAGIDDDRALDLLDEAVDAQVVREQRDTPGAYEFTHALIRQTLYGELTTPRRVRLHRKVLDALETRYAAHPDAHFAEFAHHAFQAAPGGDAAKAVDYAVRAARRAAEQAAYDEQARSYRLALQAQELVEPPDARRECELRVALCRALKQGVAGEESEAVLLPAVAIARRLGDTGLLTRVLAALVFNSAVGAPGALSLAEELFVSLPPAEHGARALVLRILGQPWALSDARRNRELLEESLAEARAAGDAVTLAQTLASVTAAARGRRDPKYAEYREEFYRVAVAAGEQRLVLETMRGQVEDHLVAGDRAALLATLAEVHRLTDELRDPLSAVFSEHHGLMLAVLEGRFADADAIAVALRPRVRAFGNPNLSAMVGISLVPARREQGRIGEFVVPTRRVVDAAPEVAVWRAGLAHICALSGLADDAHEALDRVLAHGTAPIIETLSYLYTLAAAGETAAVLGDRRHAASLLSALLPHRGSSATILNWVCYGAVDRYLGLLAMTLDRPDEATDYFESALAMHERMEAWPFAARTRHDLARALAARGESGDPERAQSLWNDALGAALEIGMPALAEEVVAAKLDLQGADRSTTLRSIDMVAAAVSIERPDLRRHASGAGDVAIVFSDLEDSTTLFDRLGDARAHEMQKSHAETVRLLATQHRGTVVKEAGDGFMLAFTDAGDAVNWSVALQRATQEHDFGDDVGPVRVRVGLHSGAVIHEGDDFFGRTVIVAARVASAAEGGQILVTDAIRDTTAGIRIALGPARVIALKGLTGTHRAFPVIWHQ